MAKLERRQFLQAATTLAAAAALRPHVSLAADSSGGKIKIGQIGTAIGGHAAMTMRTLRELADDYEVVGVVVDANDGGLSGDSAYEGVPRMTEEQLLSTPGLQAVAVETAVDDLVPTSIRAVNAGMHVSCEKPGGLIHSQMRRLMEDADRNKRHVEIGYFYRYFPTFQFIYRAVNEGWLGEINALHGEMSKQVFDPVGRQKSKEMGRTPMFELGGYLIDAMVKIMGKPEKLTTYSRTPEDGFTDNQVAIVEYPKCIVTLRSSYRETLGDQRRQFVVCGDEGTIQLLPIEVPPTLRLALTKPRDNFRAEYQHVELPSPQGRLGDRFKAFAKVLRGEQEPQFGHQHELIVHELLLRASDKPVE